MKQNKQNQLPVVINDCHALLAWIIPQLDHFPCARRFTLGDKLEMLLLEVLEYLLEVRKSVFSGIVISRGVSEHAVGSRRWLEQQTNEPALRQPEQEQS